MAPYFLLPVFDYWTSCSWGATGVIIYRWWSCTALQILLLSPLTLCLTCSFSFHFSSISWWRNARHPLGWDAPSPLPYLAIMSINFFPMNCSLRSKISGSVFYEGDELNPSTLFTHHKCQCGDWDENSLEELAEVYGNIFYCQNAQM